MFINTTTVSIDTHTLCSSTQALCFQHNNCVHRHNTAGRAREGRDGQGKGEFSHVGAATVSLDTTHKGGQGQGEGGTGGETNQRWVQQLCP